MNKTFKFIRIHSLTQVLVGSGFESHAKYAESIYFHSDDEIFVNLFIPSRLKSDLLGITLRQDTEFPYSGKVNITIEEAPLSKTRLSLRYPYWSGKPVVKVNGKKLAVKSCPSSYITIDRKWKSGDCIEIEYPMDLHIETAPDNPSKGALLYGPVVLAGDMGTEGMTSSFSDPSVRNDYYTYDYHVPSSLCDTLMCTVDNLNECIAKTDNRLIFRTSEGYMLRPLFDTHRCRYVVYWNLK